LALSLAIISANVMVQAYLEVVFVDRNKFLPFFSLSNFTFT
jgi:hypothetical protein